MHNDCKYRHQSTVRNRATLPHYRLWYIFFVPAQANLENMLQVNKTLQRVYAAAQRDLLFVDDRVAKNQAYCKRLAAENEFLQMRILTLAAVEVKPCTPSSPCIGICNFASTQYLNSASTQLLDHRIRI